MSKQSNEVNDAADQRCESARGLNRRDRVRPNRDEFVEAKEHAEHVLGLDEKVSDGMRRAMKRFKTSPLTLLMDIINDEEMPLDRKLDAAHRAFPYLHRKLEDKHGSQASGNGGGGTGAGGGSNGPTINLTLNRPQAAKVVVRQTTAERHAEAQKKAARPTTFKAKVTKKASK